VGSKKFEINGPAGRMFESTVPQASFILPAHLGGMPVNLNTLSLAEAKELHSKNWEVLALKEKQIPWTTEQPDSPMTEKPKKQRRRKP
jgi:hypothetical protein